MVAVSTESLAVLAAGLSATERASWLLIVAAVTFVLGLALYLLVLWRFDFRQLLKGRGDHWITGGALAISTLAVTRIAVAARAVDVLGGTAGALSTVSLVIWAITMAWLPLLIAAEV